jgi:hypothetical protein
MIQRGDFEEVNGKFEILSVRAINETNGVLFDFSKNKSDISKILQELLDSKSEKVSRTGLKTIQSSKYSRRHL